MLTSEEPPSAGEVVEEITRRGYRPMVAGDPMDETMPTESLRVLVQIGIESLARIGGAKTGDWVTVDMVNRGLLAFLRDRDQYGTGQHP
jgi:hypothetical protein